MSDLCLMNGATEDGDPCVVLAILTEVTREEMTHDDERQEMCTQQACSNAGEGEAGVLAQPRLYKMDQEGTLSLKDASSLIEANHANNGATGGEDKKLQYALRSNPKKSHRFFKPNQIKSSAVPASSISIISSMNTAITSAPSEIPKPAAAPLPSAAAPPPPLPAAPVKKLNSIFFETARACTECGKQFPSWKALFGHMRCHPERQWRGIQPPSSTPAKGKYTRQSKASFLASKAPPIKEPQSENNRAQVPPHGYLDESDTESIEAAYINERDQDSPRAQRGSKSHLRDDTVLSCQFSYSPSPTESEVMDEHDMADCLVMLASAARAQAAAEPSDRNSGQEDPNMEIRSRLPLISAELGNKKRSYSCMHNSGNPIQTKREKTTKCDKDGAWGCKGKFECSSCRKQFRSHQALGGHRASHKKVKGCFARTNGPEDASLLPVEKAKATTKEKMRVDMQQEEPVDAVKEKGAEQDDALEHCKMSTGQFLQYSMTCHHEKKAEDKHDLAIKLENKQLKHQTSSCSSSSSIVAATAAADTLLLPHHHNYQQQQQQLSLLSKIHQCTVCSRVFSTGQALGGHKRCHWGTNPVPHSSKQEGTPSQDSDRNCGENPQICLNICTSDKSSELSRKGQQDSSSSASVQFLVADIPLKQGLEPIQKQGLNFPTLHDTKDGHAFTCNWLVEGYALDLDATKSTLKTGHDDEGGSYGLNQEKYSSLELSNKIHANAATESSIANDEAKSKRFLSYRCEESTDVISCHRHSPWASSCERDANGSADRAKQQNARPSEGELLDLNLPAPVEDIAEEAHPAAHELCSAGNIAPVALHSHRKAMLPFCHSSCPCFASVGTAP